MNEILKAIMARKSVRQFTKDLISPEDKMAILHSAASAPTAGNQQLYTIIDVTDQDLKEKLAISCDNQPFIADAPLVLIFCADCKKWYDAFIATGCEPRLPQAGDLMLAVSDANISAQNAVIASESLGLGSCYIGDIMEHKEQVTQMLALPPYVFPAAMLIIGYPTQGQKDRVAQKRAPIELIVRENGYKAHTPEEQQRMFGKTGAEDYTRYMKAFCERKFNSSFAREMTRSVTEYIKEFIENTVE